jgi:hypothetical protein
VADPEKILDDIKFWSAVIESAKRTVVCSPTDEARVREIVAANGLTEFWTVLVSKYVPDSEFYVIDSLGLDAAHNEGMQRLVRRPL